jgi:hypothetical protein
VQAETPSHTGHSHRTRPVRSAPHLTASPPRQPGPLIQPQTRSGHYITYRTLRGRAHRWGGVACRWAAPGGVVVVVGGQRLPHSLKGVGGAPSASPPSSALPGLPLAPLLLPRSPSARPLNPHPRCTLFNAPHRQRLRPPNAARGGVSWRIRGDISLL